ncbi:MAG TPA: hypothetical protein VG711_07405 [Phycisphaerales bacterium]|nr:hypothetical protein [Phycisphaerales bacterium]
MLYRFVLSISRYYLPVLVLSYVAAFFIGLAFLFVFPQITLGLLLVCMLSLVFAVPGWTVLTWSRDTLGRSSLRKHRCPWCGGDLLVGVGNEQEHRGAMECEKCRLVLLPSGQPWEDRVVEG